MTAINLFARAEAVYLLTDCALYDAEGRVQQLTSKVAISERLRMAVAVSGQVTAARIMAAIGPVYAQADVLNRLSAALAKVRGDNHAIDRPAATEYWQDWGHAAAYVAVWSDRSDQPEAWACSTWQGPFGPSYRPGEVVGLEEFVMPPVPLPASFDPARDGLKLLEAQREASAATVGGWCAIGGSAELVTVDRHGVTKQVLRQWPDRIGERIAA